MTFFSFQIAQVVRRQAVQGGGRFSDETTALHPEGCLAGHTGGFVDRDLAAQPCLAGGALFPVGGAERHRYKDPAD